MKVVLEVVLHQYVVIREVTVVQDKVQVVLEVLAQYEVIKYVLVVSHGSAGVGGGLTPIRGYKKGPRG